MEGHVMLDLVHWIVVSITAVIVLMFLYWSFKCQRSSQLSSGTKRESLVAVRSAFMFVLMGVPLLIPHAIDWLPDNSREIYNYLPFWYCFLVGTHWGRCLQNGYHAMFGAFIAALYMVLVNYVMPGGAGPWNEDSYYRDHAWIPGGYSKGMALIFAVIFAYVMGVSGLQLPTKQYGLGVFSMIFVNYMNPNQGSDDFKGVMWTYEGVPTFTGPVWCQLFQLMIAVLLAMLTVPMGPRTRCCPRETTSCRRDAVQGYSQLAEDTVAAMERLVMHFRDGSSAYALNSSFLFLKQLGSRRTALESLLEDARWEAPSSKLKDLRRLSKLLRGIRQVLRILLEDLKQLGHAFVCDEDMMEISVYLDIFLLRWRKAVMGLADQTLLWDGVDKETLLQTKSCARRAEEALVCALQQLHREPSDEHDELDTRLEIIVLESLRTSIALTNQYLDETEATAEKKTFIQRLFQRIPSCPSRKAHFRAMRLCTAWTLALCWSVFKRGYLSGSVVTVSMIFHERSGSAFESNINRMLGIAMGQTFGSFPAIILLSSQDNVIGTFGGTEGGKFVYLSAMFLMWSIAMYGYLAAGAKYSTAYLLWAGFGSVQMLNLLPLGTEAVVSFFDAESLIENFVGCLILIIVDFVYGVFSRSLTVQQIAEAVPDSLRRVQEVFEGFQDPHLDPADVDIGKLQRSIAGARELDMDIQKEDLVWSQLVAATYNRELVTATMDECDDVFVTAFALQASASRVNKSVKVPAMMSRLVPRDLGRWAQRYPVICKAILQLEKDPFAEERTQEQDLFGAECGSPSGDRVSLPSFTHAISLRRHGGDVPCAEEAAALITVRVRIWQMCMALRRIEVVFKEQASWACDEWTSTTEFARQRFLTRVSRHRSGGFEFSPTVRATQTATPDTLPLMVPTLSKLSQMSKHDVFRHRGISKDIHRHVPAEVFRFSEAAARKRSRATSLVETPAVSRGASPQPDRMPRQLTSCSMLEVVMERDQSQLEDEERENEETQPQPSPQTGGIASRGSAVGAHAPLRSILKKSVRSFPGVCASRRPDDSRVESACFSQIAPAAQSCWRLP